MGLRRSAIEKAYALNQHSHPGARRQHHQPASRQESFSVVRSQLCAQGLEAYFTVLVEALWPKRRILEVYLNIAEFGYGTYGAEPRQRFFHKPASGSAAVIPPCSPPYCRAQSAFRRSAVQVRQQRREWILGQMQALAPGNADEVDAYPNRHR